MARDLFFPRNRGLVRRTALLSAVLVAVALAGPPIAAQAAAGTINLTAQGLRATIGLLNGLLTVPPINTPQSTWQTGQPTNTRNTAGANAGLPGLSLLGTGAITAVTGASGNGGQASAEVLGLNVLGASNVGADAVRTSCLMTSSSITADTDVANLNVLGAPVNPTVGTAINVPNVLTGTADKQTAAYDAGTGRLTYSIRGLDLSLLSGALNVVGSGTVVVAESTCSGIVKLGGVSTGAKTVVPGNSATPTVTVSNSGDIAAPNTVITVPAPPAGYTLGSVTTTGGGTCTSTTTQISCTGVTVPGGGDVTVSLPVTVSPSAASAADWKPAAGTITAVSTPVAALTGTTISASGSGTLVTVGAPQTTGGSITITPMTVPAGKNASTPITVANAGPSDATTTVTIPIGNRPDGISVVSATAAGNACTVTATVIVCSGVVVPAGGSTAITVKAAATNLTAPGTTWDLAGVAANLNGRGLAGQGRLLTVSDPDVNLSGGVTIGARTAVPGGQSVTATVRVANIGIVDGPDTTITIPAPPAGYSVGAVTTTGGGTCTSTATAIRCTGVTVPPMGAVTVNVPVTLASSVTTDWAATVAAPVTATSGDSSGQATGPIVTADPEWTFAVTGTPPPADSVRPGQSTTMSVKITNQGPSDAEDSVFVVVAPDSTTFGTLGGTAAQVCLRTGPTTLRCTVDLDAGDAITLVLPLDVSAQADPTVTLTGGCVSLNGDLDCGDATDQPLPGIRLRTPLDRRLTVTPVSATITPGTSGQARVRLSSVQDEDGLTVTIPTGQLPTGFQVTAVPAPCTLGAGKVTCTGLTLTANQQRDVLLTVALAANVLPPAKWTATGITVADDGEQVDVDGVLAVAGPPVTDVTATVTGPADGTVLPGTSTQLSVVARNAGPSDAVDASFAVVAPTGASFGPLTGAAATLCQLTWAMRAVCTVDLAAGVSTPALLFRLDVAPGTDPFTPLADGCVDLDGQSGCGPDDEPVDPIVLQVPFGRQVSVDTAGATVAPGRQDVATVSLTALHGALTGVTVTVPLTDLPPTLSVASQSATPGSTCTATATEVRCTGVTVADGATAVVSLGIAATSAAAEGTSWTATGITVARGTASVTARGRLAVVTAPDYELDITVTPPATPVRPGGTGNLTVTVDNLGPSDATGATIGVLAPDGSTFGALSGSTATVCTLATPVRATCRFDLTAAAAPLVLTLPVQVSAGADPDQPLGGGCVDRDNNGVCDPTDPPVPDIVLAAPFDRQVDISTTPAQVVPGSTGNATVLLSASPAQTGLTVRVPLDDKPGEMTVGAVTVSPSGTCTVTAAAITCTGVNVPAAGATITIPVSVPGTAPADLVWSTRGITATNAANEQATGAGLLVRTGAPQYTLNAAVTGPAPGTVLPGTTTTVRATLTNTGSSTATDALVTLRAPVGTAFGPLTAPMSDDCTLTSATRIACSVTLAPVPASLVWDVPIVVPGNADPAVALTGGCLDLDGDAACGGPGDQPLPDISLRTPLSRVATVTATNTAIVPGTTRTTTVTVTFSAARDDVRVVIPRDALPAGLTVTGVTAPAGGTCSATATAYTCGDFDLANGGSVPLTVALAASSAASPGPVWAPAVTVSQGGETLTRSVPAATLGAASAPLTVTVTGPAPGTLLPGGTGDLAVTVTNPGPSDARAARLTFQAPEGTTFVAPTGTVAQLCSPASSTRMDCTVDVAAGTDLRFVLRILVPASADPDQPVDGGCVDTNRDGACTTPPDSPLPDIELGTPLPGQITLGTERGTATPGLTGTGYVIVDAQAALTGVTMTVPLSTLPTGFVVTGAAGPAGSTCALQPTQVVCTGVTLAAGRNQAVAVTVRTASALPAGVVWTAYAIAATRNGETVQASGAIVGTGTPVPGVRIDVAGPSGTVTAGSTTTMTATITNNGPSDAVGTTATVVAPSQTTFGTLSGQVAVDCTRVSATLLSCRFDQAAGAPAKVWVLPLVVSATAEAGSPVSGGCVSLNGGTSCSDTVDVEVPEFSLNRPLAQTTTIALQQAEIAPGETGTPRIVLSVNTDLDGLTLVIPLEALPDGFTVTDAAVPSGSCTVQTTQVTCTGMTIEADSTLTVELTVAVDPTVTGTATWTAASITLTDDDDADDQLISTGVLATTEAVADNVTTTFGRPTVNPAAPGQTFVLPVKLKNPGPADVNPHVMTLVVPTGLTPGARLPDGCVWDAPSRVITCTAGLAADEELEYRIPFVVGRNVPAGTVISGGCLDARPVNGNCSDAGDQALPTIKVIASKVDLVLGVERKNTRAVRGGTVLLKLPYQNNGSQTAADVTFLIDPPAGVNLTLARILLDASGASTGLETAECETATSGDENSVSCVGPDAPVGTESELWLSLSITSAAPRGVHPVRVTISTTSPEGNSVNNSVEALLSIAGRGNTPNDNANGGGSIVDNLPKTGQSLIGLLVLSMMLVIGGIVARVGARRGRPGSGR